MLLWVSVWQDMVLTGKEELERSSSLHTAEVPLAWQHLLCLGAELGLRAGFDATRLFGKLSCGNAVSPGLTRSTLKFNSFSVMSLLA